MVFVLRVRGRSSMQRVSFPSDSATFADLQIAIQRVFSVPTNQQQVSTTPLHHAQYISSPPHSSLKQLGFQNGDVVYLQGEQEEKATPPTNPPSPRAHLTPRCTHGPRGGCPHCMGVSPGTDSLAPGKCNHGPNATCIHCSVYIREASAKKEESPAAWLCNHADTVFCPKCIIPESEEEKSARALGLVKECSCDPAKGQECIRCLRKGPIYKVDKLPYKRYLDEKRGLCKFKHGASTSCAFCLPDPFPSFSGNPNCDRHSPWPTAVCSHCLPPNANLRVQPYRHTDSVSVEARVIQNFYSNALRIPNKQRAAILFGTYESEPEETKNPGAIRAFVYAVYEPPQEYNDKTGLRFLKDEKEQLVHQIGARLGLEPVGWILTSQPRQGEKYGGKVLLSGSEVQQAARFQNRYKNAQGFSRFVTVLIEHGKRVEPVAYQVSDVAVALEQCGVFTRGDDLNMLYTRKAGKHEFLPTIIYKDRPLMGGEEFLPDELLVKVNIFAPKQADPKQPFLKFEVPSAAGELYLSQYFQQFAKEGWKEKLSDFNLLIALARVISPSLVYQVCDCIRDQKSLNAELETHLLRALTEKKLL